MKWMGRRESGNLEDRRGMSGGKIAAGGGLIGIIILLVNVFGGDSAQMITPVLESLGGGQSAPTEQRDLTAEEKEQGKFVGVILADTEDVWTKIFAENGSTYRKPGAVLFTDGVSTGCGDASAASGPFYCPADEKLYMDLAFFDELRTRFGAKGGDFTIAYVMAHEIGHHVQNLLGTSGKVRQQQQNLSQADANKLSVALELQADFYAGVFAHYNSKYLDEGDIDEALSAAQAVGDDSIQQRTQGSINQESFTHGSSEQRKYWFKKGFTTGDMSQGNTFAELR